jgi:hypothetical protein
VTVPICHTPKPHTPVGCGAALQHLWQYGGWKEVVREACSRVLKIHTTWSVSCHSIESSTSNVAALQQTLLKGGWSGMPAGADALDLICHTNTVFVW